MDLILPIDMHIKVHSHIQLAQKHIGFTLNQVSQRDGDLDVTKAPIQVNYNQAHLYCDVTEQFYDFIFDKEKKQQTYSINFIVEVILSYKSF